MFCSPLFSPTESWKADRTAGCRWRLSLRLASDCATAPTVFCSMKKLPHHRSNSWYYYWNSVRASSCSFTDADSFMVLEHSAAAHCADCCGFACIVVFWRQCTVWRDGYWHVTSFYSGFKMNVLDRRRLNLHAIACWFYWARSRVWPCCCANRVSWSCRSTDCLASYKCLYPGLLDPFSECRYLWNHRQTTL